MQRDTLALFAAVLGLLGSAAAGGQSERVERPRSERAPFDAAVNALGMERGIRRDQRSINTVYFVGHGLVSGAGEGGAPQDRTVTRAVFSISYPLPAIRVDLTWTDGAGSEKGREQRRIEVANGKSAWNETEPGLGATVTRDSAEERLVQVWLTPHGALRAMVEARATNPAAVTIAQEGSRTTLAMVLEGAPLELVLDAGLRPEKLRWKRAGKTIEAEFFDYKDWELLDVYFPQRILQRVDGRVVLDLAITDFHSNAYVVFPVPAAARAGS